MWHLAVSWLPKNKKISWLLKKLKLPGRPGSPWHSEVSFSEQWFPASISSADMPKLAMFWSPLQQALLHSPSGGCLKPVSYLLIPYTAHNFLKRNWMFELVWEVAIAPCVQSVPGCQPYSPCNWLCHAGIDCLWFSLKSMCMSVSCSTKSVLHIAYHSCNKWTGQSIQHWGH